MQRPDHGHADWHCRYRAAQLTGDHGHLRSGDENDCPPDRQASSL
jgi:hypothetical protein